jgi:hypothetical protein
MKNRSVWLLFSVMPVIVVVSAALYWNYLQSLVSFKPLDVSYSTLQSTFPANAVCAATSANAIINLQTDVGYTVGGANPMPDDVWADYRFGLPVLQQPPATPLYDDACLYRSPDIAASCIGESCFAYEDISAYSWLRVSRIIGQTCFPNADGCATDTVDEGYISLDTLSLCQRVTYSTELVELRDGQGNGYVMRATPNRDGIADLGVALPEGWSLAVRTLDAPFTLLPFGGADLCYYNIAQDHLGQSYYQVEYAGERYPTS